MHNVDYRRKLEKKRVCWLCFLPQNTQSVYSTADPTVQHILFVHLSSLEVAAKKIIFRILDF